MYADHSDRFFFFRQATEYINKYAESLPESKPTPEEDAAGLPRLSEVFGFSATLFETAERMSMDYYLFLERPAAEFYHLVRYQAWRADAQEEYRKIMGNKK